nr:immunoglobulin heavy chain junction region [Macaca mulatta]
CARDRSFGGGYYYYGLDSW